MHDLSGRVLHVITALGVGGVEVWLLELLRHAQVRREAGMPVEDMDILMTGGRTSRLDRDAASLGATLHYARFGRKRFPGFAREFRAILREGKFTAVHDHQDYSSAWHFLAGAGSLPALRIVHVHNPVASLRANTNTLARKTLFRAGRRILRGVSTHVLGTSGQLLREYGFTRQAFPRQYIGPLHCGFDVEKFAISADEANSSLCKELAWPEGSTICLFAGRLDGFDAGNPSWNHKNPEFALDVARSAIESGTDIRMVVAGDGDAMRRRLQERLREWGLSDRIALVGARMDMPRLMRASRVCLFPSREEGLGMVAVEAQAAGLRVLASDAVPREAQVIQELVTFLPLTEGVVKWAQSLAELVALPRYDHEAARDAVRQSAFSIEQSYEALHAIYSGAPVVAR